VLRQLVYFGLTGLGMAALSAAPMAPVASALSAPQTVQAPPSIQAH
jgi:hypothetical protein